MKNKTVKMILAVAVLVVCCGAYAGVKNYVSHQEQKESEEEEESSTTVFSASADDIESLDFMIDDTETIFEKNDDTWVKKDEKDFPVNQTTLDSAASSVASIESDRVLEDVDDLAEYGLDSPSNTIKIVSKVSDSEEDTEESEDTSDSDSAESSSDAESSEDIDNTEESSEATTTTILYELMASYLLAVQFAKVRETISTEKYEQLIQELTAIPEKIAKILEDDKERIQWFAAKQANVKDAFFIGRGIDYAVSLEGSLKMKEISYVHSEAYAAGELKHGTISLIEDGTLLIGILTQNKLYEKTVSNMVECKSRGAYLMGLTTFGHYNIEDTADFTVYIPKTDEHFATSLAVVPLQLLGYYVSVAKGLDVDKPRNLAKSVTVE